MIRPPLEVADIVRTYGTAFVKQHCRWLTALHLKVLRAMVACRTAALGGHVEQCDSCGQRALLQLVFESTLSKMPGGSAADLAGGTFRRTTAPTLLSRRLHPASPPGSLGLAEQGSGLRPAVSGRGRDPTPDRRRSQTSRCRNRVSCRSAHLGPDSPAPSTPTIP
jgi:hypothetical protein